MGLEESSGSEEGEQTWTSDEREVAILVSEFLRQNAVPADVRNKVTRLHDAEESFKALNIILESLD